MALLWSEVKARSVTGVCVWWCDMYPPENELSGKLLLQMLLQNFITKLCRRLLQKRWQCAKMGFIINHKRVRNVGIIVGEGGGGCTLLLVGL